MSETAQDGLPEVPISIFKANPIAFADSGALVLVHNRPRMRVLPVTPDDAVSVVEVKARLRLLNTLADPALVDAERRALAADRDDDLLEEPR